MALPRPSAARSSLVAALFLVMLAAPPASAAALPPGRGSGEDERADLTRLVSETGEELFVTGFHLRPGDRFVTPDNRLFEVVAVRAGVARAREMGRLDNTGREWSGLFRPPRGGGVVPAAAPLDRRNIRVGIYHTHSDESYLPTSGETNIPWNGDIFQVGTAMATRLREVGLRVIHSFNRHDPHDGMAYARSRRTALQLLRQGPAALVDVHRDTPPAWVYERKIAGQQLTSVLLVVGRQNPGIRANEAFAFTIKGYADRAYPGLIRGILYAAGDYNQDLFARAILAEVGSTYNRLQEAENGARLFANVLASMLADIRISPDMPDPNARGAQRF
ncbi:MAG: stage II sporulation protein P, partial [Bacillota bacterium]